MRENCVTSRLPSAVSFDLNRQPSQSVGHTQGSSHVEQMYGDLGSDWHKTLRKKGEWMTTCWELGWDRLGGAARWFMGYRADLDHRSREQQSRQTLQMQRACGSAQVHRLMVHGSYGGVERFIELEFYMYASNSRVRPAEALTHQEVDEAAG